ncbi:MAG: hypothetical protein NT015_07685 [Alphaproteobacteria bacterium]|nr:hypothetical protein [Alphaproteobacteria bacterium]
MSSPIQLPLSLTHPDWAVLAATMMPGGEKVYLTGHRQPVEEHLSALQREFCGEPVLHYYHAAISVLIRRDIHRDLALQQFDGMWRAQTDCLRNLSLRWLISACDTLMEHAPSLSDRTAGAAGSLAGNIVKLYETERRFSDASSLALNPRAPEPLFDGPTTFSVGSGDMIFNLRERVDALCGEGGFAHQILATILARLDRNDTVISRFAELHRDDATRW